MGNLTICILNASPRLGCQTFKKVEPSERQLGPREQALERGTGSLRVSSSLSLLPPYPQEMRVLLHYVVPTMMFHLATDPKQWSQLAID